MKRIAWMAVLLVSPGVALAADAPSTTGSWMVDGNVMGQPVKMTCAIKDVAHALSGTCAGAADNFAPHKVAGTVKAQTVEMHFESDVQGTPITVILSGTLNADGSKMDGELDIEPMSASGMFSAKRMLTAQAAPAAPVRKAVQAAPSPTPPPPAAGSASSTGTWKIDGDVQGTPVLMSCAIAEADKKLTGTCTGAAGDTTARPLTGAVTDAGLAWHFDTEYQGTAITVSMAATLNADGTKLNGTMSVAPMGVDGTFSGAKQ